MSAAALLMQGCSCCCDCGQSGDVALFTFDVVLFGYGYGDIRWEMPFPNGQYTGHRSSLCAYSIPELVGWREGVPDSSVGIMYFDDNYPVTGYRGRWLIQISGGSVGPLAFWSYFRGDLHSKCLMPQGTKIYRGEYLAGGYDSTYGSVEVSW